MKLCRLRVDNKVVPSACLNGQHHDLSSEFDDINPDFFAQGGINRLKGMDVSALPIVADHDGFAPVVAAPSKIMCIGLNYHDHAKEANMAVPDEPVVFLKSPSSLSGAHDDILQPPGSQMLDWEVELAFVIGQTCKRIAREHALACVAGYTILNDISERSYQLHRGGQWVKGKSYDSFTPIGPYLALASSVEDPHNLDLTLEVNGDIMQNGSSADFIFDIPTVVAHLSEFMTLEPGDIVTTGTPAGVGFGMNPQRFLKPGDVVTTRIEGLGEQKQRVVPDH